MFYLAFCLSAFGCCWACTSLLYLQLPRHCPSLPYDGLAWAFGMQYFTALPWSGVADTQPHF